MNRRSFLRNASGVALLGSTFGLDGLLARAALAQTGGLAGETPLERATRDNGGYGPLKSALSRNTGQPLIELPPGFQYTVFGQVGTKMSDGHTTPSEHDGMAAFTAANGQVCLVRNHEVGPRSKSIAGAADSYDAVAPGGTTTMLVNPQTRELVRDWVSLSGTVKNCAGGPTPWNTWISCEETVVGQEKDNFGKEHGYCFEVPLTDGIAKPVPLKSMGRFVHEAIAVDPDSGIIYLTEDRDTSGLYRFLPARPGVLAEGGKLQMLRVRGRAEYDTRKGQKAGAPLAADWVDIKDPDPAAAGTNALAVYEQGMAQGGATFARLEGAWFGRGADGASHIYVNATSGGDKQHGQVWQYKPQGTDEGELTLLFESPDASVLKSPDNLCVSPRGNLVLCEDADNVFFLRGLTTQGQIFNIARAEGKDSEFAGATFSPDGQTLFVNIQNPGQTLAIWGPWQNGTL